MDKPIIDIAIKHASEVIHESLLSQDETSFMLKLEAYIVHLLQNDFNALVNLLYKIDVSESASKACFGQDNKLIAQCLAQLIWQRQLQKAQTRHQFKQDQ